MSRTRFSRLLGSLIVLAVAIAAYLAAPPAPRAESAEDPECNLGNTGIVCGVRTECVRVWRVFYSCTMEYLRRPLGSGVDPHIEDRSPGVE